MYLILLHLPFENLHFKAMSIIAKLSFWILQPPKNKQSVIAELSFEDIILGALDQLRTEGYVEKLKTNITQDSESLPSNKDDVLKFLYNQIDHA
jgi:hypothetical protein